MEIARPQTWRLTFSKLMKNFITDTFFHYGDCSSTWPKQARGRCCFSILRRAPNGHFYGLIRLEDERRYSVDIAVGAGEQFLRLSFLAKTVLWPGILKGASHFPSRRYTILVYCLVNRFSK
jgi:hypothetical protein